jgi:hypothetical protein
LLTPLSRLFSTVAQYLYICCKLTVCLRFAARAEQPGIHRFQYRDAWTPGFAWPLPTRQSLNLVSGRNDFSSLARCELFQSRQISFVNYRSGCARSWPSMFLIYITGIQNIWVTWSRPDLLFGPYQDRVRNFVATADLSVASRLLLRLPPKRRNGDHANNARYTLSLNSR